MAARRSAPVEKPARILRPPSGQLAGRDAVSSGNSLTKHGTLPKNRLPDQVLRAIFSRRFLGDLIMATVPTRMFLTKGVGRHKEQLNSFELALRDASIAEFNLVSVSSILPPNAKVISKRVGLGYLRPGQIVHTVISKNSTNEPNRLISASIGVAVPKDATRFGYLSEHHAFGQTQKIAGDYAEDLAAEMLATTLGLPFDVDKSWDERREQWRIKGIIVLTRNVTQSAQGDPKGLWTTVVAAAILITE